ncbi:asparagine synthase (glutamine-hydrolyzing) [Rhodoplanes sp. Z2-YC6860]|uniref:asparagine synthase (glutamine-hydrolyzing) n=1 Tax=Rhodoplanes sp. Z2-YC6860 TaxID=674703 RepID=UPI00078C03B1|nr:asparagine synthase (glutamine-hydrolyzing) [Rhodoplanes sp. Z2-YC6860]AMN43753.1 Asparagine synthase [Rhodoplanes sp. Z2-YC6860]
MCGIAGAVRVDWNAAAIDQDTVVRLSDRQWRRGPDGAGLWVAEDKRIALAHRRLAIIDVGASGAQPMSDASGRWRISFNGEIYNYRELRSELQRLGLEFRTNSDTEVIINAVSAWGEAAFPKLRGMFALALWDSKARELWLARDSYGIKPLYVAHHRGAVWFASSARALANVVLPDAKRDAAALVGFYLWGHVPEPFSWWSGIEMFPPGRVQRIAVDQGAASPRSFQQIEDLFIAHPVQPLQQGELRQLLLDSVHHHLVADVPVGIFLSAGIDSNVIAALAAELGTQLRTVTLAFSEYAGTANDEAVLAELAAKDLRSEHTTVRIGRDEFYGMLDDFLASMDQPTIDGLNTYLISHATAKQGLKVALSGLGGDELFGGYPSFSQIPALLKWGRRIPASDSFGRVVEKWLSKLPLPGIPPKAAGLLSHSKGVANAYLLRRALHVEGELDALLDESWLSEGLQRLSSIAAINASIDPLRRAGVSQHAQIAALESCWYMRNQLLRDTDWSSMAHGLEVRVPFVDTHLLRRVGPAISSNTPPDKRDLAACARKLSPSIVNRAKTGFTTPVRAWISSQSEPSARGLRGWASEVHRLFEKRPGATARAMPSAVAA